LTAGERSALVLGEMGGWEGCVASFAFAEIPTKSGALPSNNLIVEAFANQKGRLS